MDFFTDPSLLTSTRHAYALASYPGPDEDSDAGSLALFVDDKRTNLSLQLYSYVELDPFDTEAICTYSKDNKFIAGLNKALGTVPIYGTILYPAYSPRTGKELKFPNDTPAGYVPCAGVLVKYAGGKDIVVPNLGPMEGVEGSGDGAAPVTKYFAPPGMVWLMRVEEGWSGIEPRIDGRALVAWAGK